MSPRSWELEVEHWPAFSGGKPYRVRVLSIRKRKKQGKSRPALLIEIEHLNGVQAGRRHELALPLPLRPDSLTTRFFRALGISAQVGQKVTPVQAIGGELSVEFGASDEGPQPAAFHPVQESQDAQHDG